METQHRGCEDHQDRKIRKLLQFTINEKPYFLPSGYYLVRDLKTLAQVSECHILAEIRNCDVDDLTDDTATHIEGGEVFKSFPGKGDNS